MKILLSPVWIKILKIWDKHFDLIKMEVQDYKNYSKIVLLEKTETFTSKTEKESQKPRPKFKKYVNSIFTENICSACSPMQLVDFFKNVLIF